MGFTSDSRLAGQSDQVVCSGFYRGFMFMNVWFLSVFCLYIFFFYFDCKPCFMALSSVTGKNDCS